MIELNKEVFNSLKINDRLLLFYDKNKYTIKAKEYPFIICTRPDNLKKTVFYTILDFEKKQRNRHNLIFNPYDFTNQNDIDICLKDLIEIIKAGD